MNKLFIILFVFFTRVLIAQNQAVLYDNSSCNSAFFYMESCNTSNSSNVKEFLQKQFNCELQLWHEAKNSYCRTISFRQYHNFLEVNSLGRLVNSV